MLADYRKRILEGEFDKDIKKDVDVFQCNFMIVASQKIIFGSSQLEKEILAAEKKTSKVSHVVSKKI